MRMFLEISLIGGFFSSRKISPISQNHCTIISEFLKLILRLEKIYQSNILKKKSNNLEVPQNFFEVSQNLRYLKIAKIFEKSIQNMEMSQKN